jgi:hypothetical protein
MIIIHYYSWPTTSTSSIQLPAPVLCLLIVWCSPSLKHLLVFSSCSETLWFVPKSFATPAFWRGLQWVSISTSFCPHSGSLLGNTLGYQLLLRRNPLLYKLATNLHQQSLIWRAPTKTPVPAGPSVKRTLFFFISFSSTITSLLCEFTPHTHFFSPYHLV